MTWKNPLIKKTRFDSPVVEQTPIIWKDRLLLVEIWQTHWEHGGPHAAAEYYLRVRDEQTNEIVGRCLDGFGFASAFVWKDTIYVFAAQRLHGAEGEFSSNHVYMSSSQDLTNWTEPTIVIEQDQGEQLFNQAVCHDGERFVMAYESKTYVPFTLKFAESDDLQNWRKIPDALYGPDKYAACPALRHVGGYYYMLYLEHLTPRWWFETYLTRSKDLLNWHDAPRNPVIAPDPQAAVHPNCVHNDSENHQSCTADGREINTSDPDLVEWQGKTRVYFTGGCQHWGGYLQYAEFDGPMQQFFESYYE